MTAWWGTYQVASGKAASWQVGPFGLHVERQDYQWIVRQGYTDVDEAGDQIVRVDVDAPSVDTASTTLRLGASSTAEPLRIAPALADRDVVSRPVDTFLIRPRDSIQLFVGSPVWAQLRGPQSILAEFPLCPSPRTWFGPSTQVGEICYESRTHCRARLQDVQRSPYRAISAITIENRAEQPLALQQLKLPVRILDLYATQNGDMWTDSLRVINDARDGMTPVHVEQGPPSEVQGAERVAAARTERDENFVSRTFSALFSA